MQTESSAKNNNTNNNLVPVERVNKLLLQSIDTLEEILKNQQLPAQERATVALKILEMTGILSQTNPRSPSTLISDAQQQINQLNTDNLTRNISPYPPKIAQVKSTFLPAVHVELQNFLSPEENQKAIEIAIQNRDQYIESTTTTKADKYRQSYVLFSQYFPELAALIQSKI
ncbi:MAG: hydroxylase, partial [Okeania sp. SIO3B3]|nr:hydroxylase [Okeania sp. SIO3B3]